MNFANPILLWALAAALPLLAWFLWWAHRRRTELAAQFISARLLDVLTVGVSRRRQVWRSVLLASSVVLVLLALARPQWGFNWEEAKQQGLDILVAIDTSRSMLATDVAPNRLERAKLEALSLMGRAKTDRLGLIAFAGTAFLQCPLTLDDEAFRQSVNALDTTIIPQGGTAMTEAIETATAAFKDSGENVKVLVLFTDGEDHEPGAEEAARAAAEEGVRIFTVGLGTTTGEPLRVRDDKGAETYIKDDAGNVVVSRLNETLLQTIATTAKGFYLNLRGAGTMDTLYEKGLAPLPKREFTAKLVKRLHEKYYWPLGLAVLLLLIEMFIPERARQAGGVRRSVYSVEAETVKTAAVIALVLVSFSGVASESAAYRAYESGKFEAAAKEYLALATKKPRDPRLAYDAATAAHQTGQFDQAADLLQRALGTKDPAMLGKALYNLGNTRYRQGEHTEKLEEKQPLWEESLKSYEAALKLDPADVDAKFNHEFVKKRLEELKQQQQKQQQDKQDEQKQDQKSDEKKSDRQKDQQQQQQQTKNDQSQEKKDQQQAQNQQQQKDEKRDGGQQRQKDGGKEDQKADAKKQSGKPDEKEKKEGASQVQAVGVMTPQQAQQLLESHKGEERTLVFRQEIKTNAQGKVFKNW
ncbi:MAG TPA: VWA domain-containing protein [Verrucomicrobiae bacterium]|jgi:Ca-activated chloride channel family protein